MHRAVPVLIVLFSLLLAGCGGYDRPRSPTPETPRTTVDCGTFGTGGVHPVTETNASVTSVDAAKDVFRSAHANGSVGKPNTTNFSYVPREEVDSRGAVRREIYELPENATLYYFSPEGEVGIDEMVIVSESGQIYRAHVGAC